MSLCSELFFNFSLFNATTNYNVLKMLLKSLVLGWKVIHVQVPLCCLKYLPNNFEIQYMFNLRGLIGSYSTWSIYILNIFGEPEHEWPSITIHITIQILGWWQLLKVFQGLRGSQNQDWAVLLSVFLHVFTFTHTVFYVCNLHLLPFSASPEYFL